MLCVNHNFIINYNKFAKIQCYMSISIIVIIDADYKLIND